MIAGVAPRAKMNQQRSRRFKSAREAQEMLEAAVKRGEPAPDENIIFDSNCITPGTPFMARLGDHLRFFVRRKLAEDPAWQRPTIIFSGHDVPGEGEHKIMEYIRWGKRSPSWSPNTRHCLYGLDADLVMLSLVTHEPHFVLLREIVSYGGPNRGQPAREVLENPCQEHFVLFQVGLLRDYFDQEFRSALSGKKLTFEYDLERIVDDFVLFCMLVGNDFLPALPTMDIAEGSLDALFEIYKELLPSFGGYLTYAGELHRGRLELVLSKLANMEADILAARAEDAEDFESKKSQKGKTRGRSRKEDPEWAVVDALAEDEMGDAEFAQELAQLELAKEPGHELELLAAVEGEEEMPPLDSIHDSEPTMMSREARSLFASGDKYSGLAAWKERFYTKKLGASTEEKRRRVTEAYIQGLHWVLEYYYRGVASWTWFYPYHYAPMASELVELASIPVSFELGEPFLPYEQLLAVQPSSSARLLPEPYQKLMRDATSPILDFYPTQFQVDLEGKRAEWEGVVLIPFIDEERLLKAARTVPQKLLTVEEKARNVLGDIVVFSHVEGSEEGSYCTSTLPRHYASVIGRSHSRAVLQPAPPPLPVGEKGFEPKFSPGTKVGATGPPGFPTLRTLSLSSQLRKAGINVFGMPSKKDSIVLYTKDFMANVENAPGVEAVAQLLLGKKCWVRWPYLQEAIVEAVSDSQRKVNYGDGTLLHTKDEADAWQKERHRIMQEYSHRQGLVMESIELMLHVRPLEGLIRQVDGTVEKRYAKKEVFYPLQLTLRKNPSPDPRFEPEAFAEAFASLDIRAGCRAIFLGRSHYGCMATVLEDASHGLSKTGSKIVSASGSQPLTNFRVSIDPAPANSAQVAGAAKRVLQTGNPISGFMPSNVVARKLGINHRSLGRLTGNVWVRIGEGRGDKIDIGILVKNHAKELHVPDYAQLSVDPRSGESRGWSYSEACVRILEHYKSRFGWAWVAIERDPSAKEYSLKDFLPDVDEESAKTQLQDLQRWLKSQPFSKRPLVKMTSRVAPEGAVRMLQAALPMPSGKAQPHIELENVSPALLLPPTEKGGASTALAGGSFDIGDRVVSIGGSGMPPFGLRGTVVAVYTDDGAAEVLFDQEFLGGGDLSGRCMGPRGAMLALADLLNLSKPAAISAVGPNAPRIVVRAKEGGEGTVLVAAASAAAGKQPKLPDGPGAKGFTMGRGCVGRPNEAMTPGSRTGDALLAKLKGADAGSFQPAQMPPPPGMMMTMMMASPHPGMPPIPMMIPNPHGYHPPMPGSPVPLLMPVHQHSSVPPGSSNGGAALLNALRKSPSIAAHPGQATPHEPEPPSSLPQPSAALLGKDGDGDGNGGGVTPSKDAFWNLLKSASKNK